jgi:hypothetical protein
VNAVATLAGVTVAGVFNSVANTLTFTFTTSVGVALGEIDITNVRVNASTPGAGVTISESVTAATGFAFGATTSQNVALSQTTMGTPKFAAYGNVAICNVKATDVNAIGIVVVNDSGFTAGFTTDAFEALREGSITGDQSATGIVGSRIALTFSNLSPGVTYYLPTSVSNGAGFNLALVGTPATPSTTPLAGGSIGGATNAGNTGAGVTVSGVYGFTPSSAGSFTAYYAVTASNLGALDSTGATLPTTPPSGPGAFITLYEVVPNSAVAIPSMAPAVAAALAGNTAPVFTQFTATNTTSTVSAVSPTGVTPVTNGMLTGCNTTLLFPYIVNTAGYDTGIAITNAGLGSSVPGNPVTSTSGSCTLQLWGSATLDGPAIANPYFLNPITVMSGQVNAFTLSSALVSATNPAGASGFAGYMIANCTFQAAHGFAFITDGFGATPGRGLSEGYLAPVLFTTFNSAPVAILQSVSFAPTN